MSRNFTTTLFTPAQAVSLTGVSLTKQRDFRRYGYLPKHEGHARYDCLGIATLTAMYKLSEAGIGPRESSEIAKICAAAIVYYALGERRAFEGPLPPVEDIWGHDDRWRRHGERLRRVFLKSRGWSVKPGRYFIWWSTGDEWWDESLDAAFSQISEDDPRYAKVALTWDLKAMGIEMLNKAGVPLVDLSLLEDKADPE